MTWQWDILLWAKNTFGPIASSRIERGLRFAEEAAETAQACGVTKEQMLAVVDRAYSRPPGVLAQEIAQAGMTLAALASNECIELDRAIGMEFRRVRDIPKREWARRQTEKANQGIGGRPC